MNRNFLYLLTTALFAGSLQAEEITLFSHRHYEADDALYEKFTKETGIKVNVVKASADELIERLKAMFL